MDNGQQDVAAGQGALKGKRRRSQLANGGHPATGAEFRGDIVGNRFIQAVRETTHGNGQIIHGNVRVCFRHLIPPAHLATRQLDTLDRPAEWLAQIRRRLRGFGLIGSGSCQRRLPIHLTLGIPGRSQRRLLDRHHANGGLPGRQIEANALNGNGLGGQGRLVICSRQRQRQLLDGEIAIGSDQFKAIATGQFIAGFQGHGAIAQLPRQIGSQEVGESIMAKPGKPEPPGGVQRGNA